VSERAALRFHVAAALLVAGVDAGAFVDANWHIHYGFTSDNFLTPTHYLLHGAWLAVCALVIGYVVLAMRAGIPTRRALPPGYGWLAVGAALWGITGIGDLLWHNAFGLEANVDAVYAPSHLGLNLSAAVMVFGVIRHSLYRRAVHGASVTTEGPLTLAVAVLMAGAMWLMWYSDPLSNDFAAGGAMVRGLPAMEGVQFTGPTAEIAGVSGIILTAFIQMSLVLFALRHLRLPVGGITFVIAWHALFKAWCMGTLVYAPAFIAAAIVGDVLWSRARAANGDRVAAYRWIGAIVPSLGITLYFITIVLVVGPVMWPTHLWAGAVALSALAGLVVSWLIIPPDLVPRAAG
jgi:hypothetical protein